MYEKLTGIIPPMTTPFQADGTVDAGAFRADVEYLIGAGVHGLAVGGSTGEGHTLTDEECYALMEVAVRAVDGRVPVVAGIIVDSTRQAVSRGQMLKGLGIAALQVTPVHYLFTPDEQAMYNYYATIASEVGIPVLVYNVVPWSYASPELLTRLITEVDGVIGVKQSAGDMHALANLLLMLQGRGVVLAAVDDLLYPCFALGAHGAIAAILTAVPELCLELWGAVQEGWYTDAREIHERLLRVWSVLNGPNLPARVKTAMRLQGRAAGHPRAPMPPTSPEVEQKLQLVLQSVGVL
ncbi:MAG: dihydrodipicolinate synthase family protein [bacterium]|nr:dihydrodipicolinate synthase family protein [bacterium]